MSNTFRWAFTISTTWGDANAWTVDGASTTLVPGSADTVDFFPPGSTADDPTPIVVSGDGKAASVVITNASVSFSGSATGGVYQFGALTIGSNVAATPATLALGTINTTSVEIGSAGNVPLNFVTVDAGRTLTAHGYADVDPNVSNAGTIEATLDLLTLKDNVTNSGTIEANGGSVTLDGTLSNTGILLASTGTITISGGIAKAGTLEIGSGGVLNLSNFTGAAIALPVTFEGVGGTLALAAITTDSIGVSGFAIGDTLQIDASSLSNPTYAGVTNAGQEVNQAGTLTIGTQTFNLTNTEAGIQFQTQSVDGNTVITASSESYAYDWSHAGNGLAYWSDIANWTVKAPGVTNVTAPGASNTVDFTSTGVTVSGGGSADVIALTGGLTLTDGTYTTNALTDGSVTSTTASQLTLNGAHLTASDSQGVQIINSSLTVENAGTIGAPNDLALIGFGTGSHTTALAVTTDSSVQTAALALSADSAGSTVEASVDATSSIEDGTSGGAAAGSITIDSGISLDSGGSGATDLTGKLVDNGTLDVNNPTLTLTGALSGSGAVDVAAGSRFVLDGTGAAGNSISLAAGSTLEIGSAAANQPYSVSATIAGFSLPNDSQIQVDDTTLTSAVYTAGSGDNGTLKLYDGTTQVESLNLSGNYTGDTFALSSSGGNASIMVAAAVCYVRGSRIRTARGEVPIEHLQRGDRVLTAAGAYRPVQWLGHRQVDCSSQPDPRDVWPIRVCAHAFGEHLPDRDLYLSPGHSVRVGCIDAALVPIMHLINGASIARVPVDEVEYWHVELDQHDVILANNLPAESYIDMNNRDFFIDRGIRVYKLTEPVLPVLHSGPMVELAREQLRARAERLGWMQDRQPNARLIIDGIEQRPTMSDDGIAQFELPTSAADVRLVSDTFMPADLTGGIGDPRVLGLSVHGIEFTTARGSIVIALDDERLGNPYSVERDAGRAWRWTDGSLTLSPALWSPFESDRVTLRIRFDDSAVRSYSGPVPAATDARQVEAERLVG